MLWLLWSILSVLLAETSLYHHLPTNLSWEHIFMSSMSRNASFYCGFALLCLSFTLPFEDVIIAGVSVWRMTQSDPKLEEFFGWNLTLFLFPSSFCILIHMFCRPSWKHALTIRARRSRSHCPRDFTASIPEFNNSSMLT
jgi:hypothetical protein